MKLKNREWGELINKELKADRIINTNQFGLSENKLCRINLMFVFDEIRNLVDKGNRLI